MRSFKRCIPGVMSLLLVLCLLAPSAQAVGQTIDYSLRGLNETFYAAFTELLASQDTSNFFGTIQMRIGEARLTRDGEERILDAAPEIVRGRTMLPIRAVAEAAGMRVDWDDAVRTVTVSDAYGDKVTASIGSDLITVNGETRSMDATPYISNGRSYFPVRAISEALNLDVAWDGDTKTVTITAPYQTARLLVMSNGAPSGIGNAGAALHDGAGMWILQFSTPSEAKAAANVMRSGDGGYQPEPDIYVVTRSAESERTYETKQDSWGALDCNFAVFTEEYGERFQTRVTVAVVDTGVDSTHPALQGHLLRGRDFVENDNEPEDEDSHGTHVAATILDCVGDAPVDILPVRVVAKEGGSTASLLSQGIKYAADRYAKVINISLGGALDAQYQFSEGQQVLDSAIQYAVSKGAVVVVSAGNDGADTLYYCPANMESAGVVVVSAGAETHTRWPKSNYGASVDLMAPGTGIIAAVPGGGYAAKSGTSMAAPHVSAAAALLYLSSGSTIKPAALEEVLRTATDSGVWRDVYTGYGFLDLSKGSVPEYRPAKVFENVLMPDRCIVSSDSEASEYPVFGSEIKRKEISSVTFRSSKSGMPAKHWDVSETQNGSVVAWVTPAGNGLYDLVIAANGIIGAPADCSRMFYGYTSAHSIKFNRNFDTANVTDMSWMFAKCKNLVTLDVSGWNTANVTNMSYLFYDCLGLTALDVSGFDTSAVTDMKSMFLGCFALTVLDVSGWNTASVTDMGHLFSGCSSLTALDASGWSTANVTDMSSMFFLCSSLITLDVGGWDTSAVTDMSFLFYDCSGLTALDVSGWDTSNVTNMWFMFNDCSGLTALDVSGWDTSNVTDMSFLFSNCSNLTVLDISSWNISKVTDMDRMFNGCSGLTTLDVSGWDTSKVTDIHGMFSNCTGLTALDINGWDTSNVTDMSFLFFNCSNLTVLDVSGWDTAYVTDMGSMFWNCGGLTALDVGSWDTSNVIDMNHTFGFCTGLTALDVSGWDAANVTNTGSMFYRCSGLTALDVSGWDTSNVTNMSEMFFGCTGLTALDVSGWNTSNVTDMHWMFDGCTGLSVLDVSGWNTVSVTNMSMMFAGCTSLTALDVSGWNTSNVTNMNRMFSRCTSLIVLDVSGFDVSNVTNIQNMFTGCTNLRGKLDISGWDLSSVETGADNFLP